MGYRNCEATSARMGANRLAVSAHGGGAQLGAHGEVGTGGVAPRPQCAQTTRRGIGPQTRSAQSQARKAGWKMVAHGFRLKIDGWCLRQLLGSPGAWPVGDECNELCSMLKTPSGTEQCFFRISDHMMYSFPDNPQMFTGGLERSSPSSSHNRTLGSSIGGLPTTGGACATTTTSESRS